MTALLLRRAVFCAAALVLALLPTNAATQTAPQRFALVIGESIYQTPADPAAHFGDLEHPEPDARAIAVALSNLQFNVTPLYNADQRAIMAALADMRRRASAAGPNSVIVFYYGGHAVLRNGVDTLVVPGARGTTNPGFIPVPDLLSALPAPAGGANIIIINACRNPNTDTEVARGVYPPPGTVIAYSTEPGSTATDGLPGADFSPYARALLNRMTNPIPVLQTLNLVARDVEEMTRSATYPQRPQVISAPIAEDICLSACLLARGAGGPVGEPYKPPRCDGCPLMVNLRGTNFLMGSPSGAQGEPGRTEREGVQRWVTVQDFAISVHEVTVAEYRLCVRARRCPREAGSPDFAQWDDGSGTHPAVNVSWNEAMAYAAFLERQTGLPFRLLSEAEWEYAARGGTSGRYSNNGGPADLCDIANHADASSAMESRNQACSDRVPQGTAPVGNYRANPFGLKDMHGNVYEWVLDCYSPGYVDLQGGPGPYRPRIDDQCELRVDRGGGWNSGLDGLRSADRGVYPGGARLSEIGFRVGFTLPSSRN